MVEPLEFLIVFLVASAALEVFSLHNIPLWGGNFFDVKDER